MWYTILSFIVLIILLLRMMLYAFENKRYSLKKAYINIVSAVVVIILEVILTIMKITEGSWLFVLNVVIIATEIITLLTNIQQITRRKKLLKIIAELKKIERNSTNIVV